jgi:hypothetical protein
VPELPAPLPPAERTVGQLVAETIRNYGDTFWRALGLGFPIAISTQITLGYDPDVQTVVLFAFSPLIALAYCWAIELVHDRRPTRTAYFVAVLVFAPVPFLERAAVLPAVAWLALFGLAPVAATLEGLGFRDALRRGRQLGLADYIHALGSLAALVIVVAVAELTLIALLRSQGDAGQRIAHALADLVLTPLLYLGGAFLYVDQAARVGSSRRTLRRRSRDADLHPPVDADATGRPDPQVEP